MVFSGCLALLSGWSSLLVERWGQLGVGGSSRWAKKDGMNRVN